jgi:DNA-binding MarR family transcriptional regulator/GNAT superfamily N-acetyltransferase
MDEAVAQLRRFNRAFTQRVGVLDDHFLARERPLGEARLLWEIGDGADIRELRARLDLDSGYMSRLLRRLEADGLVAVEESAADRRVRAVRLTTAGRAEREELDRRSDDLARSLLHPLDSAQQDRLVAAMGEVERLLTAAAVRIAPTDPGHPHARHCLREYATELDRRFDGGFDPARGLSPDDTMREPDGVLLVATLRSEPVGCGALRFHAGAAIELKSVWVAPSARGLGIARRLLGELEARAAQRGSVVRLDTNGALSEAIAMYRACGYTEIPRYNDNPYAHHWFEKDVGAYSPSSSGTTTS